MFVRDHGLADVYIRRPNVCIQHTSASLRSADNAGDPFNFGAKTAGSRSFTVAAWFKFASFLNGTSPNRYTELPFGHGNAFSYFNRLYEAASATASGFYYGEFLNYGSNVMAVNKWFFVVSRLDDVAGTRSTFMFDENTLLASGTTSSSVVPVSDTTDYFYLGTSRGANVNSYSGFLGAAGVWNRAITNTEMYQIYNKGRGLSYKHLLAGHKTNLLSWWDNDTISSDVVPDKHSNGYNLTATVSGNAVLAKT